MSQKAEMFRKTMKRYVPEEFVEYIVSLLIHHPVVFKIVKPRKTKLGDFRNGINGQRHQITINGNLNRYSFLITTIHEFAHLTTHEKYGRKAAPHGKEWKHEYKELLMPVIKSGFLPADIEHVLLNSLVNVKASSCTDQKLHRVLINYDHSLDDGVLLESLEKNSTFALNGKTFVKGKLRRTRYLCTEVESQKQYLVNALARVVHVNNGE